jgi:hypothetical protein
MIYQTYYLKFNDKKEAIESLIKTFKGSELDDSYIVSENHFADIVGALMRKTGEFTKTYEGEVEKYVKVEGFHINLAYKGGCPQPLKQYCVKVSNPKVIFA